MTAPTTEWPARPEGHTPDKTGRPDEPWLTRDAITFLDDTLHRGMRMLEYGAGGSTLWFARRVSWVNTIEHDGTWADLVRRAIRREGIVNVGLHHIPAGDNDFEDYVEFGRTLGQKPRQFDVIVIDGRRRVRCIKAVAEFVVDGGYLVLDNAEREKYAEAHAFLSNWFVRRTDNGIWRTDIFRK